MILDKLLDIREVSSKADKAYLLDELSQAGRTRLLELIFDKDVRFFVATGKLTLPDEDPLFPMEDEDKILLDLLEKLASGEFRGNESIGLCQSFIDGLSADKAQMFIDILENKTRLGIGATDINKYCSNFDIDQFKVMFAMRYEKAKVDWRKKHFIQPKIDGMRNIAMRGETKTSFFTRTGKSITSLDAIAFYIDDYCNTHGINKGFILDGEIENGTLEETGIIRRKDEQAENAIYTLFGLYKKDEWDSENHVTPYWQNYEWAKDFVKHLEAYTGCKCIRIIPSYPIEAKSEEQFHELIQWYTQNFIEAGYEGAVLKTADHVYKPSSGSSRSKDWIKIKPTRDSDGIILDILEGEGLAQGQVGKFNVKWLDKEFEVAPGKLKKDTCAFIWENKDQFIGKKIEFQYQLLSKYGVPRHAFCTKIRDGE